MDRTEELEQKRLRMFTTSGDLTSNSMKIKKKKSKGNQKKGFSSEQIKSLETMFESDTKPEPKKKVEMAAELGLQPRQVAIWFQNRRARWKSKRVEQDYGVLKARYDNLVMEYETLQKEKHDLQVEVQRLREVVERTVSADMGAVKVCQEASDEYCRVEKHCEREPERASANEEDMDGSGSVGCRSFDCKTGMSMEHGFELLNMKDEDFDDEKGGSLGLLSFGSDGTLDYSLSSTAWWNFWT